MFDQIKPSDAGVKSKSIIKLLNFINKNEINMHSILMMKNDDIFFEAYYKPFHKDFIHRMYSETKSFVGVAIGLLEEEGKINLDDKIASYFPEYIKKPLHPYLANQTIKDMLMMRTSVRPEPWFWHPIDNRVEQYFATEPVRPSGLIWEYDSAGSHVLSALVEKLSGMKLIDYLKTKLFNQMGTFKDAYVLQAPCGQSWGDSGMMCTLRDIASFGNLVMNYGVFNGKRLMNEQYLKTATSYLCDNKENGFKTHMQSGYGYQIWRYNDNVFAFTGMGDQLTLMNKEKNILIACNASNQGSQLYREKLIDALISIMDEADDNSITDEEKDYEELMNLSNNLSLRYLKGEYKSDLTKLINGKRYIADQNQMNIKWFEVNLSKDKGVFKYENASGVKEIEFGLGYNIFTKFPEEGYSNMVGKEVTKGYFYDCANSGAFIDDNSLQIEIEVIDKYFGNLNIFLSYKDNICHACFVKFAENFFREYFGEFLAFNR